MKRDKKKPTASQVDTSILMTGEEMHSLDAVCAGLVDATDKLQAKDKGYFALGNADNIGRHKAPTLEKLRAGKFELGELLDEMRASLMAAYRSGDTYRRNKIFSHWLCFVYQGAIPLLQKKHQIATALDKRDAAKKLGDAFAALPPRDKIDHPNGWADIESEAKHIADEITVEGFYSDICKAFRLDAEATAEINAGNAPQTKRPKEKTEHKRYPKDKEAIQVLSEGMRRKKTAAYAGDRDAKIMLAMINEPQSKWANRILYGKLKGKASGQVRERNTPLDAQKAADTWGKHLSAYRIDHPPKNSQ